MSHCHLKLMLVEDEPGIHKYRYVCTVCGREYGPEFAVPHWSAVLLGREAGGAIRADPVPRVRPGACQVPTHLVRGSAA